MHVIRRRGWEIPERLATPEHVFLNRRAFMAAAGAAAIALPPDPLTSVSDLPDPTKDLYPAKSNDKYKLDRAVTDEKVNTTYNNFYEFGSSKQISRAAQALKLRPWTVKIDGMVEKPQDIAIDDLIQKMPLEERLYRHRCVEAWGMAIRGRASRSRSWSRWRSRCRPRNTCGWKPSWTPPSPRARRCGSIPGPISRE
jgi:sulfoxide reductase catalytic subunit YedY